MFRKTALFVMMILWVPGVVLGSDINWKGYSEGLRLAKTENKKIFLHFRTDWCSYCKQMDKLTFQDDTVVRFLNRHFVSIRVDGDREKEIVYAHKVKGYPDNRFLNEDQKTVYKIPGFAEPGMFLFFLEYIQTDAYRTMTPVQYYKTR